MNNDMNNQSSIEQTVMRRVRIIRILGLILSTIVLAVITLFLALWGIGKEVWVARVFENMPQSGDMVAIGNFFISAFGHTRLAVQALTLLCLAVLLYLIRETYRTLVSFFASSHS